MKKRKRSAPNNMGITMSDFLGDPHNQNENQSVRKVAADVPINDYLAIRNYSMEKKIPINSIILDLLQPALKKIRAGKPHCS